VGYIPPIQVITFFFALSPVAVIVFFLFIGGKYMGAIRAL
jgi:hypothetical protein